MKYDLRDEIDALKRRIEELERRPAYVPVYVPVPALAAPRPYFPSPPPPNYWPLIVSH